MSSEPASVGTPGLVDLASYLKSLIQTDRYDQLSTSVLPALVGSVSAISKVLQISHQVSLVGTANAFGDEQLNVDVAAENLIRSAIATCPSIVTASSEEDPVERAVHQTQPPEVAGAPHPEQYTVAFDPLDGSSIIATNWSVGTIIGVWEGSSSLHQAPASRQVAAVLGVFGPRTTAVIGIRIPGMDEGLCLEVGVPEDEGGKVLIIRPEVRLASTSSSSSFKTRYFAPANLRAAAEDEKYRDLINHYVKSKYTLRYSGGLVPDVVHALVKGHGIYVSPVTDDSQAKLRRLFELYPIALIIECAGGVALDPADGQAILSKALEDCDERTGFICGTADEVEFVKKWLLK